MITREFNLYLHAGHSIPLVINANQYDRGEQWLFTLFNSDGTKYVPSSGAIVGIKSDNLGIINTGSVDAQGRVVINETQQMTAAVGKAVFELLIDDQSHGTANFIVLVEPKPGDNADLSESDLSLIQQAIDGTSATAIAQGVSDWMDENLTPTTPPVDASLTVSGAAADSAKVGQELSDLKSQIAQSSGLTADVKQALMDLANAVAFKGNNPTGQTLIDALEDALYPPVNLMSISAVYSGGTVYDTASLDDLRADLVVTAHYDDYSAEAVTNYTLSGTLTVGTSTITVSYGGKTTTFNVTVTAEPTVYTLTDKVFANDGATDSGIAYLSDGDKAFSIMCDATFSEQTMRWSLFKMMNSTSPWAGILFGQANANSDYAMVQWMTTKTASSGSSAISLARSYTGRVRVVLTHSLGSDALTYYIKVGSAQIIQGTLSGTFTNITANLAIGGTLSGTEGFNGTVNSFKMYDYVLNQTKIDDFFA